MLALILILVFYSEVASGKARDTRNVHYVGIPVPGQTLQPADVIQAYLDSCNADVLTSARGEDFANELYRGLFSTLPNIDVSKLTGRWFTVIDSPNVHRTQSCSITYIDVLSKSEFAATMSSSIHSKHKENGKLETSRGYISKTGSEPGSILFSTGSSDDMCPYFLVATGPENEAGKYSYLVWSQLMKQPLMVFANDWNQFDGIYKREVLEFLENHKFINPLTRQYGLVQFQNFTKCDVLPYQYY